MFYEVRIFDAKGELKKVISSKILSNRFWRDNEGILQSSGDVDYGGDDWSSKNGTINRITPQTDESYG